MKKAFPTLDLEPKEGAWSSKGFPHLSGAPPPYRSYSSVQEEEDTNLWSSSDSSSYNSNPQRQQQQQGSANKLPQFIGKRRSSWSSLIAQENMSKDTQIFSKSGSPTSAASSNYHGTTKSLPQKTILSPHSLNGSAVYVNQANYNKMISSPMGGAVRGGQEASRQTSLASSGVVSDFLAVSNGGSYYKFPNESVPYQSQQLSTHIQQPYPGAPLPAERVSSPRQLSATTAAGSRTSSSTKHNRPKRNRMEELRRCWKRPATKLCCLAVTLFAIAALILSYVLTTALILPKHLKFSWLAPDMLRQGQHTPNMLQMDVASEQIRFDLAGNMPFKSNFISVLDFKTNKVAIVDSSLRSGGRNLVCFVIDLDRQNIPDQITLQRAAKNSAGKTTQQLGWQESWNYIPSPLSPNTPSTRLFQPEVAECRGARWIELTRVNTNQKPMKCTECYDFCLPEYGIEKDYIRDETFLNIVRRNCFYLFVPEWRSFAQSYSTQQNQQDFEAYYQMQNQQPQMGGRGGNGGGGIGGGSVGGAIGSFINQRVNQLGQAVGNSPTLQKVGEQVESKWISLQQVPQQVANFTSDAYQTIRNNANQFQQELFNNPNSNNNNQEYQQRPASFGPSQPNNNQRNYAYQQNIPYGSSLYPNQQANYNNNNQWSNTGQSQSQQPSPMVASQFSPPQLGSDIRPYGQFTASNTNPQPNVGPVYNTQESSSSSRMNPNTGLSGMQDSSSSGSSAPSLSQLLMNANRGDDDQQQAAQFASHNGNRNGFGDGQFVIGQANPPYYGGQQQQAAFSPTGGDLSAQVPPARYLGNGQQRVSDQQFPPNFNPNNPPSQWSPNQNPNNMGRRR